LVGARVLRTALRADRRRGAWELAVGTVVLTLLTWNADLASPDVGLDNSWQGGLYMGVHEGLQFGRDAVFTYGPLGFLQFPALYDAHLALASYAYVACFRLATAALLLWVSYRMFGSRVVAVLVTLVGVAAVANPTLWQLGYDAPVPTLAIVAVAWALRLGHEHPLARALPCVAGVLAGMELLAKLTVGALVASLAVYAIAVGGGRRGRRLAVFAVLLVLSFAVSWALVGGSPGAVPDYLTRSWAILSGYSQAMGGPKTGSVWAAAALALVVLVGGALLAVRRSRRGAQLALLGLLALFVFQSFKAALVTGGSHIGIYFGGLVAAWFAIPWQRRQLGPALVAFVVLIVLFGWGTAMRPSQLLFYGPSIDRRVQNLRAVVEGTRNAAEVERIRKALQARYAISPRLLTVIGTKRVHVEPFEENAAWAYRLNWRPIPVFQAYQAYTPTLDQANAHAYASPSGPQVVLRENASPPLHRQASFESPAAVVSMLCHFQHVAAAGDWEVVGRVPDRCGTPRLLRTARFGYGVPVRIPRVPGELVTARIRGVNGGLLGKVVSTAYRSPVERIFLDGNRYRFVPGTADDGLLLRVPRRVDFPSPFSVGLAARTFTITNEWTSSGSLSVSFYATPITPARR
jgi:hypothetical protein